MARRYDTISFLSDYGLDDEFVGVVRSVIRTIAPAVGVVDITHGIPPHDIRAGSLTLARSVQYLAPGIVLAIVDPGVGTDRRAVAIEVGDDGEAVFVGPDNGLLASAVAMVGGATRAVELTEPAYQLPAPGPTFAGRDVFGPAAAHLASGVPITDLGPEIDPVTLRPGLLPLSRDEDGQLAAEVLWIDRYGNVQLNVDPEDIGTMGERVTVVWRDQTRTMRRAVAYADLGPGEAGLVVDSYGLVSLALNRASAAELLRIRPGDAVTLRPPG